MVSVSIVEDTVEIRQSIESLIKMQDDMLLLSSFANAEDAAVQLRQQQPDIVIMDINLPGMSGIDCIQLVKDDCPATQFMIFTIYENDDKVFDALAAGANGYLLKKTTPEKMIAAIHDLHSGGAPMTSQIARKVLARFAGRKTTHADLTPKENQVLALLAKGYLYKEIAQQLNITSGTVTQHIHNIYEKLHVQNRTEAINKVFGNDR